MTEKKRSPDREVCPRFASFQLSARVHHIHNNYCKWSVLLLEKIARPRAILKKSHFDQRYYQHQHHGRRLPYPHPTPTSAHQTTARHLLFQLCAALEDFFGPGGFIALLILIRQLTQINTTHTTTNGFLGRSICTESIPVANVTHAGDFSLLVFTYIPEYILCVGLLEGFMWTVHNSQAVSVGNVSIAAADSNNNDNIVSNLRP